jgi:hypothetical protein
MARKCDHCSTPERDEDAAIYWFARYVTSIAKRDYILASEALKQLKMLGFSVSRRQPFRRKGGA